MPRQKQALFFGGDLIHPIFIKDSFIGHVEECNEPGIGKP